MNLMTLMPELYSFSEISLQRIAGLGITAQQLEDWLLLKKSKPNN